MEIRVKIGANEAIVTVTNADEAIDFLEKLSLRLGGTVGNSRQVSPITQPMGGTSETGLSAAELEGSDAVDEDLLRQALLQMRGKASGKIMEILANSDNGCKDVDLKREFSGGTAEGEQNLGPVFAHLSKSCKRVGIDKTAVLLKKSKRGPKGKMSYFYRATDAAARIVRETPHFGSEPEWDAEEGFE